MARTLILLTVAILVAAATADPRQNGFEAGQQQPQWFNVTQRVDNFNPQNTDTFQQRFVSSSRWYQVGGPILVIVGGFHRLAYNLETTLAAHIAQAANGSLFYLEHRFIGESTFATVGDVPSKRFLTPDQALEDLARFLAHIKSDDWLHAGLQHSAVILVGEDHGGSLAVWFRQKYPHLANAAWASRSQLLAQQNNPDYKELAGETFLQLAGPDCYNVVEAGFRQMGELADAGSWAELQRHFNTCTPLETETDVSYLFVSVSIFFTSYGTYRPAISTLCSRLQNPANLSPLDGMLRAMGIATDSNPYCYSVRYQKYVDDMKNGGIASMTSAEFYVRCSQLGGFKTSDSPRQPFGSHLPIEFFNGMCRDVFGDEVSGGWRLDEEVQRLNVRHGGLRPRVSNVLITYGDQDPGRSLQVPDDLGDSVEILRIAESSVAKEFYQPDLQNDSVELLAAKRHIVRIVQSWL